jgi:hypothetical protein
VDLQNKYVQKIEVVLLEKDKEIDRLKKLNKYSFLAMKKKVSALEKLNYENRRLLDLNWELGLQAKGVRPNGNRVDPNLAVYEPIALLHKSLLKPKSPQIVFGEEMDRNILVGGRNVIPNSSRYVEGASTRGIRRSSCASPGPSPHIFHRAKNFLGNPNDALDAGQLGRPRDSTLGLLRSPVMAHPSNSISNFGTQD